MTSDSVYGAMPTTGNTPPRSGGNTRGGNVNPPASRQSFQPFQGKGNVLGAQNGGDV